MDKIFFVVIVALVLIAGGFWYVSSDSEPLSMPGTLLYSYTNASTDDIIVFSPQPRDAVSKKFSITGTARGTWYFEASFPVEVRGQNGETLAQTYATAQGEWMTEEFVPFLSQQITIPVSYSGPATVILHKDNPSGLPENDASVSFPIIIQ